MIAIEQSDITQQKKNVNAWKKSTRLLLDTSDLVMEGGSVISPVSIVFFFYLDNLIETVAYV